MSNTRPSFTTPTKGAPSSGKYTMLGSDAKGTPSERLSLSYVPPALSSQSFNDDIDGYLWLEEIDMEQYAETFLTNLSLDGRIILRKRLSNIRQQDLAKMNITNFQHQKEIMQHIKLVLKFPFNSPIRKKEVTMMSPDKAKRKMQQKSLEAEMRAAASKDVSRTGSGKHGAGDKGGDDKGEKKADSKPHPTAGNQKKDTMTVKEQLEERKKQARRRRSFDEAVWNKINNMRTKQQEVAAAADILRDGLVADSKDSLSAKAEHSRGNSIGVSTSGKHVVRGRRWSFGGNNNDDLTNPHNKGMAYGNLALQYDMIQSNLRTLQHEYLSKFKASVKCERASIFFVNDVTKDLILLAEDDQRWYRIPAGASLAGACAETGECINVADAYNDHRFNRNLDIRTGYRTRSVLCQPVRRSRGAGAVVAVIEMMNKIGGEPFDMEDEHIIAAASQHVAEALAERFKELETCAETFAAIATFVGGKNSSALISSQPGYTEHTASSQVRFNVDS